MKSVPGWILRTTRLISLKASPVRVLIFSPSGISIYIYVEPDAFPKNPCTELKIPEKSEKLLKFHWILENDIEQHGIENLNVIKDKYTYITVNGDNIHPGVRSSCSFEKGKDFFVLKNQG